MFMHHPQLYGTVGAACAVVAAGFDIRSRRIPNALTAPALAAGILLHFWLDGWSGVATALLAAVIAGFIFLLFFIAGGMGGGDVKLIAAVACIMGLPQLAYLLVFTSLAGGAMGLWLVMTRGLLRETIGNMFVLVSHHFHRGLTPHPELNVDNGGALRLPYGIAIAAGSLLTLLLQGNPG
jgi:prepilin peptidase CpaA